MSPRHRGVFEKKLISIWAVDIHDFGNFYSMGASNQSASQDSECNDVQPKDDSANDDHSIITLGLRNLLCFLPIDPKCHPNICSGRETSPIASAIGTYRKQPKHRSYKWNDEDDGYHLWLCFLAERLMCAYRRC